MNDAPTLYILDGSYYVFRAFYAIRNMSNSKGFPTNGLFAFTNMLLNLVRDVGPTYLVVAFDPPGDVFRNELYADYKANREAPPEELVPQFPVFRRIVEALNIPVVEVPGFEADDAIGTLVRHSDRAGIHTTVLTGDKDLYQLVDDDTVLYDSMRDKRVGIPQVLERFQVPPSAVPDVLGLAGDTSDNIPGVPGIGEKTAGKLIAEFGSLEVLLENIDRVSGAKRKENLATYADQARLSKTLATIRCDVPLTFDLDAFRLGAPDFAAFDALCAELEFGRFPGQLRELFAEASAEQALTSAAEFDYRAIFDLDDLDACLAEARRAPALSFDLETTSVDPLDAEIVGFALAWKEGAGVYVPVAHSDLTAPRQLERSVVLERLRPLLEDPAVAKVGQHTKYEIAVLARAGVTARGFALDTMLAAYLIDPNRRRYNLDVLAQEYLGHANITYSDVAGSGRDQKRFDEVPIETATPYAAEDADVTLRLAHRLGELLGDGALRRVHDEVEVPLTHVLARMETTGVRLDTGLLRRLHDEFGQRIEALTEAVYDAAGHEFTINSPKQLGVILFEELGLPVQKRTKTGPSTDQSVLETLAEMHALPRLILEHRQLSKLVSTYVDALPRLVRRDTGRVHTSYHQAVAATGRLSSADPNLQNIPIRSVEGRRIREAFVPEQGWVLFGGDYSQIELRVLAHMSAEPVLIDAFAQGEDIHRRTAAEIFEVPRDEVTSEQRAAAKTINFGVIYGMGAQRLARDLGIAQADARDYIARYFERIGSVKAFFDGLVQSAVELGYAETMIGRRRPIPELTAKNGGAVALGERLAINTPIQGTAADLIKMAMIRIDRALTERGLRTRMLLQVHDELVFEAPPEELDEAMALVRDEMEHVVKLAVPLKVDMASGATWAELK